MTGPARQALRAVLLSLAAAPAAAGDGAPGAGPFRIEAGVLIYDTEDQPGGIAPGDATRLIDLLRANPKVLAVELNSSGGDYFESFDLAHVIADFELETRVRGYCESSCAHVFLGGSRRTLARGGRIGFHRTTWSPENVESYYTDWQEDERWRTPFDMVSWTYEDTQGEVHDRLMFMVERGVDPLFAIETLREEAGGIWYPDRDRLRDAGVITE